MKLRDFATHVLAASVAIFGTLFVTAMRQSTWLFNPKVDLLLGVNADRKERIDVQDEFGKVVLFNVALSESEFKELRKNSRRMRNGPKVISETPFTVEIDGWTIKYFENKGGESRFAAPADFDYYAQVSRRL